MCTAVVLFGVLSDAPLVVAHNRDEYRARRSTAPRLLDAEAGVVGGLDLPSRGTWFGTTRAGLVVAITNHRTGRFGERTPASRGQLVLECLRAGTVTAVRERLLGVRPRDYNPFNLLFGDAGELWIAYGRRDARSVVFQPVSPGVHVLPNAELDSRRFAKVRRARALLDGLQGEPFDTALPRLGQALADHDRPQIAELPPPAPDSLMPRFWARRLDALCVHGGIYGTRSSSIAALGPGQRVRHLFARGAPCRTRFEDTLLDQSLCVRM